MTDHRVWDFILIHPETAAPCPLFIIFTPAKVKVDMANEHHLS